MAGSVALLASALQRAQMAIAQGALGTATRGRSTSTDRKRGWRPWQNPLTEVMKGAFYRIFGELDLPARYRYTTPPHGPQALPGYHHPYQRYGSLPLCIVAGPSHALV